MISPLKEVDYGFTSHPMEGRCFVLDTTKVYEASPFLDNSVDVPQVLVNLTKLFKDGSNFKEVHITKEFSKWVKDTCFRYRQKDKGLVTLNLVNNDYPYKGDEAVMLLSGGKDSVTLLLDLLDIQKTYKLNVRALYVMGANPCYTKEHPLILDILQELKDKGFNVPKLDIVKLEPFVRVKNQADSPLSDIITFLLAIEVYKTVPFFLCHGCANNVIEDDEGEEVPLNNPSDIGSLNLVEEMFNTIKNGIIAQIYNNGDKVKYPHSFSIIQSYRLIFGLQLNSPLASCMTIEAFKVNHQKRLIKEYGLQVEGVNYLPAVVEVEGKGLTDVRTLDKGDILLSIDNKKLKYESLSQISLEYLNTYYSCVLHKYSCGVCFKCVERLIAFHLYCDVPMSDMLVEYLQGLALKSIKRRSQRDNYVPHDLSSYLKYFLQIDLP